MAKEVNYSKTELEGILKGYLEQKGLLLQSLERIEGAIIAVNNLLNPRPKKEVISESSKDSNEEKVDEIVKDEDVETESPAMP